MNIAEIIQKSQLILKGEYPTLELKLITKGWIPHISVFVDNEEKDISISVEILQDIKYGESIAAHMFGNKPTEPIPPKSDDYVIRELVAAITYELKR